MRDEQSEGESNGGGDESKGKGGGREEGKRGEEKGGEVAKAWICWKPFPMWTRVEMPLGKWRERPQVILF